MFSLTFKVDLATPETHKGLNQPLMSFWPHTMEVSKKGMLKKYNTVAFIVCLD